MEVRFQCEEGIIWKASQNVFLDLRETRMMLFLVIFGLFLVGNTTYR